MIPELEEKSPNQGRSFDSLKNIDPVVFTLLHKERAESLGLTIAGENVIEYDYSAFFQLVISCAS